MDKISRSVLDIAQSLTGPEALKEYEAYRIWPRIVGEKIARVAQAETVAAGILTVRVGSAVWRQELSLLKGEILGRYRENFGEDIIKDLIFR